MIGGVKCGLAVALCCQSGIVIRFKYDHFPEESVLYIGRRVSVMSFNYIVVGIINNRYKSNL